MKERKPVTIGEKHILFRWWIPILPILLLLLAVTSGCTGGGMKGMKAPEYEPLLDWDYAMENFGFEILKEDTSSIDENIDAVVTALGIDRIRQGGIQAEKTEDMVSVISSWEHCKRLKDKSLIRRLLKWEPVKPELVKGFQEEDLAGIFALGNPTELVDLVLDWFITGEAWDELLEGLSKDDRGEAKTWYGVARMTVKGYWMEAREDYWSYIGDEIAAAAYVNRDFTGWDENRDGDTFDKASPVHCIIAVELKQPGLSDALKEMYTDNEAWLKDILFAPSFYDIEDPGFPEPDDEFLELHTKKIGGEEICYIDVDGYVQVAWYESDNMLFIGDLAAIENIDEYYDASNPTSGLTDRYCKFTYVDGDMLVEYVIPDDEFETMSGDFDEVQNSYSQNEADAIQDFIEILNAGGEYGVYQKVFVTEDEGFEITLQCSKRIADIYLSYMKIAEASKGDLGFWEMMAETLIPMHFLL